MKAYILYDSDHCTFWKKQNNRDSKNTSGFQALGGVEEKDMNRWSTGDF